MGRYGLSWIEPSHAGFNPLKHPWGVKLVEGAALDQLHCSRLPKGVKALMRELYPILIHCHVSGRKVDTGIGKEGLIFKYICTHLRESLLLTSEVQNWW